MSIQVKKKGVLFLFTKCFILFSYFVWTGPPHDYFYESSLRTDVLYIFDVFLNSVFISTTTNYLKILKKYLYNLFSKHYEWF